MKYKMTEKELADVIKYRRTSGIMTAVAVAMYIICWLPVLICGVIGENVGTGSDMWSVLGISIMMLIIAAATAIIIIKPFLKPVCLKGNKVVILSDEIDECGEENDGEDKDDEDDDDDDEKAGRSSVEIGISGGIWIAALVGYLCLGIGGGLWHPGWIIFIVALVVDKVVSVIFSIVRKKRDEAKKS